MDELTDAVAAALADLRRCRPHVMGPFDGIPGARCADVLREVGCVPVVAGVGPALEASLLPADAALVHLGVGDVSQPGDEAAVRAVVRAVVRSVVHAGTPWVLDPAGAGQARGRTALARDVLAERPAVLLASTAEVLAVVGGGPETAAPEVAPTSAHTLSASVDLAATYGCAVVVTGVRTLVTDGRSVLWVAGGPPPGVHGELVDRAHGALIAAYLPVAPNSLVAALAGTVQVRAAGAHATALGGRPEDYWAGLVAALASMSPAQLLASVRFGP